MPLSRTFAATIVRMVSADDGCFRRVRDLFVTTAKHNNSYDQVRESIQGLAFRKHRASLEGGRSECPVSEVESRLVPGDESKLQRRLSPKNERVPGSICVAASRLPNCGAVERLEQR